MTRSIARLGLIAVITAATLVTGAGSALACSCVMPEAEGLLESADAAFVGTLIQAPSDPLGGVVSSADLVPWVFEIEAAYKGNLDSPITILSAVSGASCGLEMMVGDSASLFVYRAGDHFEGNLCSTMGPEALSDGPFEAIGFGEDLQTGSSLARWALGSVLALGAGAAGVTWIRRRGGQPEA